MQRLIGLHTIQSDQPTGTTTWCFGNHDARQTLSWDDLAEMDFDPWTEGDGALVSFTASHHSTVIRKATRISPGFSVAIGLWGSCFIFGNTVWLYLEIQYHDGYTNVRQFRLTEKFYICVYMYHISCSKVSGWRESDAFFECFSLSNSNHNIPKKWKVRLVFCTIVPKNILCFLYIYT